MSNMSFETDFVSSCVDTVNFILENGFSTLKYSKQLLIKQQGRPTPAMPTLSIPGIGMKQKRGFNESNYTKTKWLTASIVQNKLYCWQCLLFTTDQTSIWGKIGFDNLQTLSGAIVRHEKSQEHIFTSIKLELFGKQNLVNVGDSVLRNDIENFNETVRKNREILKRLIDAIIYLSTQEHNKRSASDNEGSFRELIDLLKTYDPKLQSFLTESTILTGTSETIQDDLINSISSIIKSRIEEELQTSFFFSWQIHETTDIACKTHLSVIFRYVVEGELVERFAGFYDVSNGLDADSLLQLLVKEFDCFDVKHKLIAQTYDGAAIMSGQLNGFQTKVKNLAPQALLTHCYDHKLNLVLNNGCNGIKEVRIFFANLSGFTSFFSKSSKRSDVLNAIVEHNLPSNALTQWDTSMIVCTIHSYREKLIEIFDLIPESEKFINDRQTLREAVGLKQLLVDQNFIFFLNVFKIIFEHTDVFFQILQSKSTDVTYSKSQLNSLIDELKEMRSNEMHFNSLYDNIFLQDVSFNDDELRRKKRKTCLNSQMEEIHYKQIFAQILDTIIVQLDTRFSNLSALQFFDLINVEYFAAFSIDFPVNLLNKLIHYYPFFDRMSLKNELSVLYSDQQLLGESKFPQEMLTFIYNNNLTHCLPEFYKLLCLVLSIPVTSTSIERSFSTLERIKTYTQNTMAQEGLTNVSLLSIEKHLLHKMKEKNTFYDSVINHFANSKTRNLPLIYKEI